MLYRWEFSAAMIFHMCWAPRTRIRILKKFDSIMDENKDWPHEIWFKRCQFATTLLTIFGSSRMWTFIVYVSDAVEKKSNGCFPMRKFHEIENSTSPLWVCSVQPSWPGTVFSHNGQHNNNPNNLNLLEKIKKKISEVQISRKLMNMPRSSVTPKIEYQDQLQGNPVS